MKYFMVEGNILDAGKINGCIMKEHMSYTQAAMDQDIIFLSGLKTDMSGGIFIIKAETREELETYLENEPFRLNGIQEYRITEFSAHYANPSSAPWF